MSKTNITGKQCDNVPARADDAPRAAASQNECVTLTHSHCHNFAPAPRSTTSLSAAEASCLICLALILLATVLRTVMAALSYGKLAKFKLHVRLKK